MVAAVEIVFFSFFFSTGWQFKGRTETLHFLAHSIFVCGKKVLEKIKASMLQKSGKKMMMSHGCQVTKLKPTTIKLMSVSVGSSLYWRCFSSSLVQFGRKKTERWESTYYYISSKVHLEQYQLIHSL